MLGVRDAVSATGTLVSRPCVHCVREFSTAGALLSHFKYSLKNIDTNYRATPFREAKGKWREETIRKNTGRFSGIIISSLQLILPEIDPMLVQPTFSIVFTEMNSVVSHAKVFWSSNDDELVPRIDQVLRDNTERIRIILPTQINLNRTPAISFYHESQSKFLALKHASEEVRTNNYKRS